jgi:hypothetical protein
MKYLDENGLLYVIQKVKTWLSAKVDKVDGKGLSTNDYTTAEKNKLSGLSNYTLPTASASQLGGVKVGAGLEINNGILSATGGGTADAVDWENVVGRPTKVSEFTNDANYVTSTVLDGKGYQTATQVNSTITSKGYQTEAQVKALVEGVIGSAPDALNTLDELAQALGDDPNFATTITTELGKKVNESDLNAITNAEIDTIVAS